MYWIFRCIVHRIGYLMYGCMRLHRHAYSKNVEYSGSLLKTKINAIISSIFLSAISIYQKTKIIKNTR